MIFTVFSVYDSKAGAHLPPFVLPRVEMAQRVFGDCCNSTDHQFSHHPEDYSLWSLGSWDDESGAFTANKKGPINLGNGLQYLRPLTLSEVNDSGSDEISDDAPVRSGAEGGHSA